MAAAAELTPPPPAPGSDDPELECLASGRLARRQPPAGEGGGGGATAAPGPAGRQFYFRQPDYDSLIEACGRKLAAQPGHTRALMIRANAYAKKGGCSPRPLAQLRLPPRATSRCSHLHARILNWPAHLAPLQAHTTAMCSCSLPCLLRRPAGRGGGRLRRRAGGGAGQRGCSLPAGRGAPEAGRPGAGHRRLLRCSGPGPAARQGRLLPRRLQQPGGPV